MTDLNSDMASFFSATAQAAAAAFAVLFVAVQVRQTVWSSSRSRTALAYANLVELFVPLVVSLLALLPSMGWEWGFAVGGLLGLCSVFAHWNGYFADPWTPRTRFDRTNAFTGLLTFVLYVAFLVVALIGAGNSELADSALAVGSALIVWLFLSGSYESWYLLKQTDLEPPARPLEKVMFPDFARVPGRVKAHGYVARPAGKGPWPGVIVLHEVWGWNLQMRLAVERLSGMGYLTVAPDLYRGRRSLFAFVHTLRALKRAQGEPFEVVEAVRSWLRQNPNCTGEIGVVGFSMGAEIALAVASSGYSVVVANYGRPPKSANGLAGSRRIVASYGGRDWTLGGVAKNLEDSMSRLGVEGKVKEYGGVGHSFIGSSPLDPTMIDRVVAYFVRALGFGIDAASSEDAWTRIEEALKSELLDRRK